MHGVLMSVTLLDPQKETITLGRCAPYLKQSAFVCPKVRNISPLVVHLQRLGTVSFAKAS